MTSSMHITPRRRRHLAATVGVTALAMTAAACGSSSPEPGPDDGQAAGEVVLTFVHAQDPGTFDKVIASFEAANPGIRIEEQNVPFDDLNSTVQSRLSTQDASIDLYDVDAPRLASFAARGMLEPLDDLREKALGQIEQGALDALVFDGQQMAMPRWTSTQLLFVNHGLLEAAGVDSPSSDPASPITWEEIAQKGAAAQAAGATWGFTFDQVGRYYQLQPLPEQLGGGPGLTGDDMLTPDVTNDGWVNAFTWYGETFESGLSPRGIPAEQTPALFASGETAFFVGGPWNTRSFEGVDGLDWGVAPFPVFADGTPASSTGSWATGISPFSDNIEEAKAFLAYMTTTAQGAEEATSNNIPLQADAQQVYLEQMAQQGGVFAELAAIIEFELANNATPRPTTVGYVEFETEMNRAFDDIANGSDPATRLAEAADELTRTLERYQG